MVLRLLDVARRVVRHTQLCTTYSIAVRRARASRKRVMTMTKNDSAKNLQTTYKQPDRSQTIDRRAVGRCSDLLYGREFRAGISIIALLSRPLGLSKG